MVIEQLLNTMSADLRIWIRERKPGTGAEAGSLADNYLQARKRESGVGVRVSSQEGSCRGKWAVESKKLGAVELRVCHTCGEVGHISPNCPKKNPRESVVKGDKSVSLKCYNCGKRGHMSMQCPSKALFCGEKLSGAITRKGKVEGIEVTDILLDTGCSRTMVRRSLVPEERCLE